MERASSDLPAATRKKIPLWLVASYLLLLLLVTGCSKCEIIEISPAKMALCPNETISVAVTYGNCGSGVTFVWRADNGLVHPSVPTNQSVAEYTAPDFVGSDIIYVNVKDAAGKRSASGEIAVSIVQCSIPSATPSSVPATMETAATAATPTVAPLPTSEPTTTPVATPASCVPGGPYGVCIYLPQTGPQDCPGDGPCLVAAEGRFEGPDERQGIDVMVLVSPVEPPGGGWWIQDGLMMDRLEGTWRIIVTLGEQAKPPQSGHRFSLRALLVEQQIADDPQYGPGVNLEDYTVIPRLAASARIDLDILTP